MLFEMFIEKKYWKYHDHWLGYCTNELIQIDPQEKYYKFGIQTVSNYLDYMQQRETSFPTFLEMLMATYYLVEKAKKTGYAELIETYVDEEKLIPALPIHLSPLSTHSTFKIYNFFMLIHSLSLHTLLIVLLIHTPLFPRHSVMAVCNFCSIKSICVLIKFRCSFKNFRCARNTLGTSIWF